jgi:hypothetical protein
MPAEIDYQAGTLAAAPNASQPIDEKPPLEPEVVDRADGEVEVYEGLPTQDELKGENALRRVSAPIPWAVYTIAFVELCERFSYYGTQVVCRYPHCLGLHCIKAHNYQSPTSSTALFPMEVSQAPTHEQEPAVPLTRVSLELLEKALQLPTP